MTTATPTARRGPVPYDFRRPSQFNREHVRALQIAGETFARQFTTVLSTSLRVVSQVSLREVGQLSYDEYVREIPNPTYLAVLSLAPLAGQSLLHVPLPLTMSAVDRLLGGTGEGSLPERPLSDIEQHVIRGLVERSLRELSYAFESFCRVEVAVLQQESNPQIAQVAAPTDPVVTLALDVRIGASQGEVTICVPLASLKPVLEEVAVGPPRGAPAEATGARAAIAAQVGLTPVDVHVAFREVSLTSGDLVGLRPGDVLPLHHGVAEPLTVVVAGVPCFAALPGRRGNRLACRIVDRARQEEDGG